MLGLVDLGTANFRNFCTGKLEFGQLNDASSVLELLMLREGYMSAGAFMSKDDINFVISCVSIN